MTEMFEISGISDDRREVINLSGNMDEHFDYCMKFIESCKGIVQFIFRFYVIEDD